MSPRLLYQGEKGYEQARVGRVFNARRPDRYPAALTGSPWIFRR